MKRKERQFIETFEPLDTKPAIPLVEVPFRSILEPPPGQADEELVLEHFEEAEEEGRKEAKKAGQLSWDPETLTDRILAFSESLGSIHNYKLYPYQRVAMRRIVYSILRIESEEFTMMAARQIGKSDVIARMLSSCVLLLPNLGEIFDELAVYRNGFWAGVFAPLNWQVQTVADRVRNILRSQETLELMRDPELDVREHLKFQFTNGSRLFCHTISPKTNVESKTLHLVVVDEAQQADDQVVQRSVHPMAAAVAGTIVKIGIAGTKRCDFLTTIERNRSRQRHKKSWKNQYHYEFDDRHGAAYNPYYKRFIAKEKERLGEDSDNYQLSYRLQWLLERRMFISAEDLDSLEDRKRDAVQSILLAYGSTLHTLHTLAGLDLGKSMDSTVLTIGIPRKGQTTAEGFGYLDVLQWWEWRGDDHESQYHQIVPILREFRVSRLCMDSTGLGDPIADRYKHNLPWLEVVPVVFSQARQSEMFKLFDRELRGKRISFPAGASTRKTRVYRNWRYQMEAAVKEYRGPYLSVQSGEQEGHDDYVDSSCLLVYAMYGSSLPTLQQSDVSIMQRRGKNSFLRGTA